MYIHTNVEVSQRHIVKSSKIAISGYPVNEPKCSFLSFFFFFAGVRGGAGLFFISTFKRIMFSYMYMVACTL